MNFDSSIHISQPRGRIPSTGLVCHLNARRVDSLTLTGARVDEMRDMSGNGHHFATSAAGVSRNPSYDSTLFSGRGGIYFSKALGQYLESVVPFSSVDANACTAIAVFSKHDNNYNGILCDKTNTLRVLGFASNLRMGALGDDFSAYGIPKFRAVTYGVRSAAGTTTAAINREPIRPMFAGTGQTASYPLTTMQLCARGGASNPGDIRLGALWLWSRVLSDAEFKSAMRRISTDWGTSSPSSLYNIVIEGNSLVVASNDKDTPPVCELARLLSIDPSTIVMRSYVGRTTEHIASNAQATDALLREGRDNVLVVVEGTNSLIASGAVRSTIQTTLQSYCTARQTAGWKVVVTTLLPRRVVAGNNQSFEADRVAFNTWLRSNYTTFADGLADPAAIASIGAPGAETNTTYYETDQTHLKDAGSALLADELAAGVAEALA